MTGAVLLFTGVCLWTWAIAGTVYQLLQWRRNRALNRAIERDIRRVQQEWDEHVEHPTITGYVPPEDRPEWGLR